MNIIPIQFYTPLRLLSAKLSEHCTQPHLVCPNSRFDRYEFFFSKEFYRRCVLHLVVPYCHHGNNNTTSYCSQQISTDDYVYLNIHLWFRLYGIESSSALLNIVLFRYFQEFNFQPSLRYIYAAGFIAFSVNAIATIYARTHLPIMPKYDWHFCTTHTVSWWFSQH